MHLALALAAKARGRTRPNPMVGAVVVRAGRVVGTGWHRRAGGPHAEVLALRHAGPRARGATLYVSLEPCAHTGRTPPCTEAIASAGIRRVVAAMKDPNPKNRGRGLRRLKARGIRTSVGLLEKEARALNRVFITWRTAGRPFVTGKVAQSLDGKIATRRGSSRWISGPAAREWVHRLRGQVDAILVGVGTVLKDNPRLTVRNPVTLRQAQGERPARGELVEPRAGQPIRVILDSRLRTPPRARIFASRSVVVIAATARASTSREARLRRAGAEILRVPSRNGRVDLRALLRQLAKREISHLLIEGGGEVIASAFEARVVDRLACIIAPTIIGGRDAPTAVEGTGVKSLNAAVRLGNVHVHPLGKDLLVTADVHRHR